MGRCSQPLAATNLQTAACDADRWAAGSMIPSAKDPPHTPPSGDPNSPLPHQCPPFFTHKQGAEWVGVAVTASPFSITPPVTPSAPRSWSCARHEDMPGQVGGTVLPLAHSPAP